MDQSRRKFLSTVGAATVGIAAGARSLAALGKTAVPASAARIERVGIQLYSVRRLAATDLPGTIAEIGKIGYKEVELAGYYNKPASEFRKMLDDAGLKAPSGHIGIDLIENQTEKTFADAHTMGHEWITVPSLPRGKHETADDWKAVAAQFNLAATKAKAAGFRFAFHNHNDIVKKLGDVLPIEILMKETDPSLVNYQMDIYWAISGGADPVELMARHPGRFKMLHVKDGQRPPADTQTDVGAGTIDFKTIFSKAKGIEHYFVESDTAKDPIAFAAASYKYLANLTF